MNHVYSNSRRPSFWSHFVYNMHRCTYSDSEMCFTLFVGKLSVAPQTDSNFGSLLLRKPAFLVFHSSFSFGAWGLVPQSPIPQLSHCCQEQFRFSFQFSFFFLSELHWSLRPTFLMSLESVVCYWKYNRIENKSREY